VNAQITTRMPKQLLIDVYFELICPWCWIGKRNLAQALSMLSATGAVIESSIRWHAVQLLPDLPEAGQPFGEFYLRRLGSAEAVKHRQAQVCEAAERAGLQIDFSSIPLMPNTAKAHRLLAFSEVNCTAEQHELLLETLFAAHFTQGLNIGETASLLAIAKACAPGVAQQVSQLLSSDDLDGSGELQQAREGVPYFVFDERFSVAGAQPPEVLLSAMRQAMVSDACFIAGS
jgi:predicted DsbA family dithiol-disulfide isomerase